VREQELAYETEMVRVIHNKRGIYCSPNILMCELGDIELEFSPPLFRQG